MVGGTGPRERGAGLNLSQDGLPSVARGASREQRMVGGTGLEPVTSCV